MLNDFYSYTIIIHHGEAKCDNEVKGLGHSATHLNRHV